MRNILEKYHHSPGFALLLGSILQFIKAEHPQTLIPELMASFYLIRRRGERHILGDMGFSAVWDIYYFNNTPLEFFTYLKELLENPERSKTHVFDQQRYVIASKECLQLCLCHHHNFSNKAMESTHRDDALRRNKPWLWKGRLGVHSRIRRGRHRLKVRQGTLLKAQDIYPEQTSFPDTSPEHEHYRSLSYRWALDLLPFFLERSAVSLELADILRGCTFAMMGQKFPWRMRLAKVAITKYLLLVDSGVNSPDSVMTEAGIATKVL